MSNNAIVHVIEEEEDYVPPPPLSDDEDDGIEEFEPWIYLSPIPLERENTVNIIEEDENRYGKDLSFHTEKSEEDMLFGIVEHEFCNICCDSWANMTASCGHKYCPFCVVKIIIAERKNAPQPRCSFCRVPFNKFTTPSISTALVLTDWAEKSFPTDTI
jgi:hypothetical protein